MKKTLPDGVVIYTYGETKTIHTTHPSGLSVIEFPNGQVEKHLPDGSQEIVFPDQTFKCSQQMSFESSKASAFVAGTSAPEARSRPFSATVPLSHCLGMAAKRLSFRMDKKRLCALQTLIISTIQQSPPLQKLVHCAHVDLTFCLQVSRWYKGARIS